MARAAGGDGGEAEATSRYLTDLDRLEEYSATHAESFDELGEWQADRFEAAWDAYQLRRALELIEEDRKGMTRALYANGMIGGQDLTRELTAINNNLDSLRAKLLGTDLESEEQMSDEAPMPVQPKGDDG